MEPTTITLQKPIETPEGVTLKEMEVRRPTGADLWQLDGLNVAKPSYRDFVKIVSVCQQLPISTVKGMDGADVMAIANELLNFLGSSLPTGGTSGAT